MNDAQREFVGRHAIRAWADKEIFGDHVTMDEHHGQIVVHARVDGDFDKSKLPDPVTLIYYFSVERDAIAQLVIVLNTRSLLAWVKPSPEMPSVQREGT